MKTKKYKKLWKLAKDTSGTTLDEYEACVDKDFGGYLLPHIDHTLSVARDLKSFLKILVTYYGHEDI